MVKDKRIKRGKVFMAKEKSRLVSRLKAVHKKIAIYCLEKPSLIDNHASSKMSLILLF